MINTFSVMILACFGCMLSSKCRKAQELLYIYQKTVMLLHYSHEIFAVHSVSIIPTISFCLW